MEAFIEAARRAETLAAVDFAPVHEFIQNVPADSGSALQGAIAALVDAYSAADSSQLVLQCALMKCIGCILRSAAAGGRLSLEVDDYILLALFFNEISTVGDAQLFLLLTEAVTPLFQQSVALVFGPAGCGAEECSPIAPLRGELQSLWLAMARRLVAPANALESVGKQREYHGTEMLLGVVDCLRALLLSLLQAFACDGAASGEEEEGKRRECNESVMQAVCQVVEGVLLPLTHAVESLRPSSVSNAAGSGGGKSLPGLRPSGSHGETVSPLVLVASLRVLEELTWRCAGCSEGNPVADVGRFAVSRLLAIIQQYLVLQQQKSMKSVGMESQEKGPVAFDLLRAAGAQHALRRLLSVTHQQISVFMSLENAVTAALNVFGGKLDVENPLVLARVRQEQQQQKQQDTTVVGEKEKKTRKHVSPRAEDSSGEEKDPFIQEWEEAPSSSSSRLRECEQILPVPNNNAVVGTATNTDFDDAALLDGDAENGTSGAQEALLKSTVGLVSANALVEMVFLSVSRLDIMSEQAIQSLHLQGLQKQQYEAVRRAQRAEVQRLRHIEQQGVEGIPVGRLLEHLKESTAMYATGAQLLDSESGLAAVQRAALFSLLDAYDLLADEQEGRVREAQALIARTIAQMPSSMMDSALDAVCVRLRGELSAMLSRQKASERGRSINMKPPPLASAYQLSMQILFALYSAQAPVHERGSRALMFDAPPPDTTSLGAMGSVMELRSRAAFTIDTDNPIEWLQSTSDAHAVIPDRKRSRGGDESFSRTNNAADFENGNDASTNEEAQSVVDGSSHFFRDDIVQRPCSYSHFLCRLMEILTEAETPMLLLELLLQCPRITRYTWHYVHKHYCLSTEKARCVLGMWLLKSLAERRSVCRRYALNSILHMSAVWSEYPRRLAVKQLGTLLGATVGPSRKRVVGSDTEALLIRYTRRQIAAIPVTRLPPTVAGAKGEEGAEAAHERDTAAALRAEEMQKLTVALDRHLGSFLMMCARQPRELFPSLLDVFKECIERQNTAMAQLLVDHVDVRRMCQRLFQTDALSFMSNVMPYLRRYSNSATMLVQKILWAISAELRSMGKAGEASGTDMERIATALLGHARVMYENSEIPLLYYSGSADSNTSRDLEGVTNAQRSVASLHDVRFVAPFMSLIPVEELKQSYLRSFLHFVEQQLQHQQQQQRQPTQLGTTLDDAAALDPVYINKDEIQQFIRDVAHEVLVRAPIQINDNASRGISRVDLLVYLHRASHDGDKDRGEPKQSSLPSTGAASAGGSQAEMRGILSSPVPNSSAVDDGDSGVAASAPIGGSQQAAEGLPVSPLTTKEVICALLKLRRTFDESTSELLYGPTEIKGAVRQLMQNAGGMSVPSQLMATLIFACGTQIPRVAVDLVRFVHQEVLLPLAKDSTWEKDVQLWRGVLLFAEMHYRECSNFLVNLPDQVLIHALRARPQLCEYFREEHGNNAYFSHILGSL
uniref:Uncharacterized protein TCIL3000_8_7880 n=1 Tax=Trypanosoma congolense (strain IL3000) TaxID=1068625 RepID=G0UT45_TRYCI|nr:unnamed protein product [Trypanosoma congolense IL3000]